MANYLNNKNLIEALTASHDVGIATDTLAEYFVILVERYSRRQSYNFLTTEMKDDMRSGAVCKLLSIWRKFDVNSGKSAFCYFSVVVNNDFSKYLNRESKAGTFLASYG